MHKFFLSALLINSLHAMQKDNPIKPTHQLLMNLNSHTQEVIQAKNLLISTLNGSITYASIIEVKAALLYFRMVNQSFLELLNNRN